MSLIHFVRLIIGVWWCYLGFLNTAYAQNFTHEYQQALTHIKPYSGTLLRPTIETAFMTNFEKAIEEKSHMRAQHVYLMGLALVRANHALTYHLEARRKIGDDEILPLVRDIYYSGKFAIFFLNQAYRLLEVAFKNKEIPGKQTLARRRLMNDMSNQLDVLTARHQAFTAIEKPIQ